MDSLSDDEGDEEAAMKFRADLQRKDDNQLLQTVITGVTEGADAAEHRNRRQGFSFEELVGKASNGAASGVGEGENAEGEGAKEEEELDFEEMLQRGLSDKAERERQFRRGRGGRGGGGYDGMSDDDEEDEGEEGYNTEEEMERMKEMFSTMTEEEKRIELENMQRRKEAERNEALRRKQMEKEFKIRRELRLQAKRQQSQSSSSAHSQLQSQSQSQLQTFSSFSQLLPSSDSNYHANNLNNSNHPNNSINPPFALKDVSDFSPLLLCMILVSLLYVMSLRSPIRSSLQRRLIPLPDHLPGIIAKTPSPLPLTLLPLP